MEISECLNKFEEALLSVDRVSARNILQKCYEQSPTLKIIEKIIVSSLERIGDGWEDGNISLSQVYMSGLICEEFVDEFLPKIAVERKTKPKMAIGVLEDHHALGKRIVISVIRANGYDIHDYGQGLKAEEMIAKAVEDGVEILLVSTLMLSSALKVKDLKDIVVNKGLKIKVITGGAPFRLDSELWKEVGADANGKNASEIIQIIEKVV